MIRFSVVVLIVVSFFFSCDYEVNKNYMIAGDGIGWESTYSFKNSILPKNIYKHSADFVFQEQRANEKIDLWVKMTILQDDVKSLLDSLKKLPDFASSTLATSAPDKKIFENILLTDLQNPSKFDRFFVKNNTSSGYYFISKEEDKTFEEHHPVYFYAQVLEKAQKAN